MSCRGWHLLTKKGGEAREERNKKLTQLKKQFERADTNGDGEISKHDWFSTLNKAGYEIDMSEVEELFLSHDKDLDGKLSWEELTGQPTKTEMAFKALDVNHDRALSKEEFKKSFPQLA